MVFKSMWHAVKTELCKSVQTTLRINFKTSPKYVLGNARLMLLLYVCMFVVLVHFFLLRR